VLDTEVPMASIVNLNPGAFVPMGLVPVEFDASTAPAASDIAYIELWMNGPEDAKAWTHVETVDNTADPNYDFLWDTSALTDGETYWLRGMVMDQAGNTSWTDSLWVVVDGSLIAATLSIPDAMTLCGMTKVAGDEVDVVVTFDSKDTYDIEFVKIYTKDSDLPDLFANWGLQGTMSQGTPDPGNDGRTVFQWAWDVSALSE